MRGSAGARLRLALTECCPTKYYTTTDEARDDDNEIGYILERRRRNAVTASIPRYVETTTNLSSCVLAAYIEAVSTATAAVQCISIDY